MNKYYTAFIFHWGAMVVGGKLGDCEGFRAKIGFKCVLIKFKLKKIILICNFYIHFYARKTYKKNYRFV